MGGITDINFLYNKYYGDNPELRRIVTIHSEQVAKKAIEICESRKLPLDTKDVYIAAMLHDIGVVNCHAPDICAYGSLPYIQHGIEGRKILEENGLYRFASICDTHTGSGISKENIRKNKIPLPPKDYFPISLLEKLICYSDKFFSKSQDLTKEKNIEDVINQMKKFGEDSLERFLEYHSLFSFTNQ